MTILWGLLLVVTLPAAPPGVASDDWPGFRGPNGSGRAIGDAPLPAEIGPATNVLWKTALPPGHSSPVVHDGRIFLTAVRDDRLLTIAVAAADGAVLWEREAPYREAEQIHPIGSLAQPSVATDGEHVVSVFGSAGVLCYGRDGELLWQRPMGPPNDEYGTGSSPLLTGGKLIVSQDHDTGSFVMALDVRTGETLWRTSREEFPRSYASPILWDTDRAKQVVVPGTLRAVGYDLETGEEVWTVRGLARIVNPTAVTGEDGTLFLAAWAPGGDDGERIQPETFGDYAAAHDTNGSGTLEEDEVPPDSAVGSRFRQLDRDKDERITEQEYESMRHIFESARNVAMAVRPGGKGDITESHVLWTHARGIPYVPSPLYHDGHLFLVRDGGIVTSLDARTGRLVKRGRIAGGNYYSSPVVGDGKIYLVSERGEATAISAEGEWAPLSQASFGEDVYATPALVGGRIYLRTSGHLYCFGTE